MLTFEVHFLVFGSSYISDVVISFIFNNLTGILFMENFEGPFS